MYTVTKWSSLELTRSVQGVKKFILIRWRQKWRHDTQHNDTQHNDIQHNSK
jgi:hypothetical protein